MRMFGGRFSVLQGGSLRWPTAARVFCTAGFLRVTAVYVSMPSNLPQQRKRPVKFRCWSSIFVSGVFSPHPQKCQIPTFVEYSCAVFLSHPLWEPVYSCTPFGITPQQPGRTAGGRYPRKQNERGLSLFVIDT